MKTRLLLFSTAISLVLSLGAWGRWFTTHYRILGFYSELTQTYWCTTPSNCIHERGHQLDQSLGFPSVSPAFNSTLEELPDQPCSRLTQVYSNDQKERYACFYEEAGGNLSLIPAPIQKYYMKGWQ